MTRDYNIKCAVKDCENHSNEGQFVGLLCLPCHRFIAGDGGLYSQACRNSSDMIKQAVEVEREACAEVCEMQENRIVQTHPARIEFDPNSMMARKCAGAIRARGSK
jgi:hypothetical protein